MRGVAYGLGHTPRPPDSHGGVLAKANGAYNKKASSLPRNTKWIAQFADSEEWQIGKLLPDHSLLTVPRSDHNKLEFVLKTQNK